MLDTNRQKYNNIFVGQKRHLYTTVGEGNMNKKMKIQRKNTIFSIVLMSVLAIAIVIVADTSKGVLNAISGTAVDISSTNATEYQVKELYETEDGGHKVLAVAKGFNTDVDIEVLVTFDENVENILALEVLNQAETDGLGSKITEEDFTAKFADISAPVMIADLELASPVTGSIGISDGATSGKKVDSTYNPERWNQSDESPEANAMRKLYASGLLLSEDNQEGLQTPKADMTAEEIAIVNMEKAGLLDEYLESKGTESTPETEAIEKLREAGLLSETDGDVQADQGATIEVTNIDAISGATVSSKAVGEAVNNAYFFLKESILK